MKEAVITKNQVIIHSIKKIVDVYLKNKHFDSCFTDIEVQFSKNINSIDKEIVKVVKPAICIVCDKNKLGDKGCLETPNLIIEFLSLTNTRELLKDKFELYEAAGVREYWIVGLVQNFVLVYYLNEQRKYIGIKPFSQKETFNSVIFPELKVDLNIVFE